MISPQSFFMTRLDSVKKITLMVSFALFLLGCVTVTEVPEKGVSSRTREPSPPVVFQVDRRYAGWYTNIADIENSKLRAQAKGDFLAASALYFKAKYASNFHNYFTLRSPTGRYSKLVQEAQSNIERDKERREAQIRLKNDEAVKEIDRRIKSEEKYIKELTKEKSPQELAFRFVIDHGLENRLGGIMFLMAYTHVANKGEPMGRDEQYITALRTYRVSLANTLADPKIPADVKKKGFELGDTLIKIEELFMSAKHEEAQALAHKVATDILNQE